MRSTESIVLQVDGFPMHREADGSFRIRDIDLAERLGYDEPRAIRKLISRMVERGELPDVHVRDTVSRTSMPRGGERVETVSEYWLDRIEVFVVIAKSETKEAMKWTRIMATVFDKVLQQYEESKSAIRRLPAHLERWFLSASASSFEALWPDSLVQELERLHGRDWLPRDASGRKHPHPHHMKSTYPAIYDRIMSSPVARKMMANNPDRDRLRHHQFITPEARPFVVAQLGIIEAIARTSSSKSDFWARLDREYGGAYLQLALVGT